MFQELVSKRMTQATVSANTVAHVVSSIALKNQFGAVQD